MLKSPKAKARKKGDMTDEEVEIVKKGVFSAQWICCSPIEWKWDQRDQENMAKCILILSSVLNEVIPPYTREHCQHKPKYCRSELCKKCYDRLAQKHKRYLSSPS